MWLRECAQRRTTACISWDFYFSIPSVVQVGHIPGGKEADRFHEILDLGLLPIFIPQKPGTIPN